MRLRTVGSVTILDLSGKLSGDRAVAAIGDTLDSLVANGHLHVLLDLNRVSYVDSAGLGTLLAKRASFENHGGALKLVNLTSTVQDLLAVTKLAAVFETFDSEAEAVGSFSGPPQPDAGSRRSGPTPARDSRVSVLLVAEQPDQSDRLGALLDESSATNYTVTVTRSIGEATSRLSTERFDLVLLDLPDDAGLASFWPLRANGADTSIVVLGAGGQQHLAHEAMRQGAQDFLDRDTITPELLDRTLRYAQDRQYWHAKHTQHVDHELEVAALLQERFLPQELPIVDGFDIHGYLRPSGHIGGDFYDFIEMPGPTRQLGIAVGDASGKGIPGALLMAKAQSVLRAETDPEGAPDDVVRRVNRLLCAAGVQDRFVTLFFVTLVDGGREIRFVNAGHPHALLIQPEGVKRLSASGPPLGLFPDVTFEEHRVAVKRDDLLVIYSDGITEAQSPSDTFFDERGILDVVRRQPDADPLALAQAICGAAEAFERGTHPPGDDKTVVVVRVTADHPRPVGTQPAPGP